PPGRGVSAGRPGTVRASLFATCLGDRFFARGAADAVRLLRSLDVQVDVPAAQTCCGQPAWNAGHMEPARAMARHTARVFAGDGYVVLPSGSCTAMVRRFYPALLGGGAGGGRAAFDGSEPSLAPRVWELAEFVVDVLGVTDLGRGLEGRTLAYHHGCHALRELGQRAGPLELLRRAGADVVEWEAAEECCGFGGLFAVKNAPVSVAMADRKLDTLPPVEAVVSADGGCLLHLEGRARRRGLEVRFRPLASLLWEARGEARETAAPGVVRGRA
ncbi:MAG TPA: (Fe-S)-binding protein, partial [Longimicrobiales bacterium]|nr:(Fe-S)-binding protein [Longimicrobiales bacterium]